MTLYGLLESLGQIAINDRMCNYAAAGSSVYQINPLNITDYPIIFVSPTGTNRVSDNTTTYSLTIFYISRLLEDNSNEIDVQSTAIEVLKNIIKKSEALEGIVAISEEYTINVFIETERFKDRCTGAYAQADFTILNDTTCVIYSGDADSGSTSGDTHFFHWVTAQDTEIPYSATSFNAEWRTNYGRLGYIFSNGPYEIERGWTDSIRMRLEFPENLTENEEEYSLTMLEDLNDQETLVSTLNWKQGGKSDSGQTSGNTYFYYLTEDYTTVDYNDTSKEIKWRTDYDGIYYELTKGGNLIDSGNTILDRIDVHFPENLTSGVVIYDFSAYDTGGTGLGTIRIAHAPYEESGSTGGTYFRFANEQGTPLPPHEVSGATVYGLDEQNYTETGITIHWETDYTGLTYVIHKFYFDTYSGRLHKVTSTDSYPLVGNQQTITYPENNDWFNYTRQFDVFNGGTRVATYQWRQISSKNTNYYTYSGSKINGVEDIEDGGQYYMGGNGFIAVYGGQPATAITEEESGTTIFKLTRNDETYTPKIYTASITGDSIVLSAVITDEYGITGLTNLLSIGDSQPYSISPTIPSSFNNKNLFKIDNGILIDNNHEGTYKVYFNDDSGSIVPYSFKSLLNPEMATHFRGYAGLYKVKEV